MKRLTDIDKKLAELTENIMKTKAKFNSNSVLNLFESKEIINEETKLLASYSYELEKLILKKVLLENGHEEIADDFDESASFPKHKEGVINENIDIIQSSCKLFGEHVDVVFNKTRNNFHEYLKFLVDDAAGPKTFVKQAKAAQSIFTSKKS